MRCPLYEERICLENRSTNIGVMDSMIISFINACGPFY